MSPKLTSQEWLARYQQQARWTHDLRQYLYTKASLESAQRVLDLGCGPGALVEELLAHTQGRLYGLDIDLTSLQMANRTPGHVDFVQGDAHELPFPSKSYDIALCHFLLLWVENPFQVLAEMRRVVRPGGTVLAMAEPDYGARVDYPEPLVRLGEYQRQSLRLQGADPFIGRKLAGYFHQAGLVEIECGILGGQWNAPLAREEWESEWKVMESDLQHLAGTDADLEALKNLDWNAWLRGERILYVPTFYAWGRVSG